MKQALSDHPWLASLAKAQNWRCDCCEKQLGPDLVPWPSRDPEHPVAICRQCSDSWARLRGETPILDGAVFLLNRRAAAVLGNLAHSSDAAVRQWEALVVRMQNNQCDCCGRQLGADIVPWRGPDPECPVAICLPCAEWARTELGEEGKL